MKPICTYEPDCVPDGNKWVACMFLVSDGTGQWVSYADHEEAIREMQRRYEYLQNCYVELQAVLNN